MDVPGGGGGSPVGSETGTSGPWQGGGCHFLGAPLSAAPSLPRASPLGPPLGHPAAPGGQTCPCGWTQSSADPCLDPCLEHRYRQPLARTPPGEPRAGPPQPGGLCKSSPHPLQGPPLWGQLLRWSLFRTCCPPISSCPGRARPCSLRGSCSPLPTWGGLSGAWGGLPHSPCWEPRNSPHCWLPRDLHHPHTLALPWSEFASSGFQPLLPGWTRNLALWPQAPPAVGQTDGLGSSTPLAGLPGAPGPCTHRFASSLRPSAWMCPCSTP